MGSDGTGLGLSEFPERRTSHAPHNKIDFSDYVQAECNKNISAGKALICGTVDGIITNGADRIIYHPEKATCDAVGSIAVGIALKAAPKWLVVPAALIGGAGSALYLKDSADALSQVAPFLKSAEHDPIRARSEVAKRLGPLAVDGLFMVGLGGISAKATNKATKGWLHVGNRDIAGMGRLESESLIPAGKLKTFEFPFYDARTIFNPRGNAGESRTLYKDLPFKRTHFKDKNLRSLAVDDDTKFKMIRATKPSDSRLLERDGHTVIPIQKREFLGVGYSVLPSTSPKAKLYNNAKPSVVKINTPEGVGTGFIVRDDGLVATALHVVEDSRYINVHLDDRTAYLARVVAHDFDTDLALLKLSSGTRKFKALPLGAGVAPKDHEIFLIGHPEGSDVLFMSPGLHNRSENLRRVVEKTSDDKNYERLYSGKKYAVETYFAHGRPGNSGGPVLNSNGEVIAIHSRGIMYNRDSYHALKTGSGASVKELRSLMDTLPHELPDEHKHFSLFNIIKRH